MSAPDCCSVCGTIADSSDFCQRCLKSFISPNSTDCCSVCGTIADSSGRCEQCMSSFISSNSKKLLLCALDSISVLQSLQDDIVSAFTNQIQTDILVKPGNNGPSDNGPAIPAHKVILAARSGVLRNMLESDECKAPASDSITIPDLRYEELQAFLQFLYSGHLTKEQVKKHCYSLLRAGHKYEVTSLENFCATRICKSIGRNNVLVVLEFARRYSVDIVVDAAIDFIVQNQRDIVFSPEYEAFANRNADLNYRVTKALVKKDV